MEHTGVWGKFRKLVWAGAMLLPILFVLTVGSVSGQEKDKREVKVDVTESKAVIESESRVAHKGDELKIEFDNGSHNFNFEYESEDAGAELEAEIKVELFDLIEWRDVNRNGRYDPDLSGELVQKIGLGDLSPKSLVYAPVEVAGNKGVKLVGVSADPAKYPNFTLTLTLHMFGEFLNFAGTSIEPTSMKFDIGIKGFPYQRDDTSLALYTKVVMEAEGEADKVGEKGDEAITARLGKYISFFSWETRATVDGQPKTVGKTLLKHEEKRQTGESELVNELYLLYPRGNDILHDPKLGVLLGQQRSGGCRSR